MRHTSVCTTPAATSRRTNRLNILGALACLCLILCPCPSLANSTYWLWDRVITFDDVSDGTIINNHYGGVTFSVVGGTGQFASQTGGIYARANPFAESSPNVVSLVPPYINGGPNYSTSSIFPFYDERWGKIQAQFATPQMIVSIDAAPVLSAEPIGAILNVPYLQAFDSNGSVVGTAYYPYNANNANYGTWQRLTVQSNTNNIAYVQFSSQHSGGSPVYGEFDRLEFEAAIPVVILPYRPIIVYPIFP